MSTRNTTIVLVTLTVMAAVAFAVPTGALAEATSLCPEDTEELPCPEGQVITHVHLATKEKALLKRINFPLTIECDVLFLGDTLNGGSEGPLRIDGNFTYTNCSSGSGSCTFVAEENGPFESEILKEGHEEAVGTTIGLLYVNCPGSPGVNCRYIGENVEISATGTLLASLENGEIALKNQHFKPEGCVNEVILDIALESLEPFYIANGEEFKPHKTALCSADDPESICLEEHKPSTVDFKDSGAEFLTSLISTKCEGLISGSVGAAGEPQKVTGEYKFSSCTNGCVVTEISGGSQLGFLFETSKKSTEELASATTEGLELFYKCGETVKCAYGPVEAVGDALGALKTGDNGHITFSKDSLGEGEGIFCPEEASLDALFVASSAFYIREDYGKPPTSLCSKDEKSPFCKSENQLKTIDYKDKAVELLTNLINVKCEGLVSGSVSTPAPGTPLEIKPELTYTGCSGGCFVTSVAGPGKVMLERTKSEEAKATAEGFEIFVKCGTTIKCLLGPEKMVGTALGALTTGDNGHLTWSKVSLGKGEGATCPKEATLDALYVASSAAYIG